MNFLLILLAAVIEFAVASIEGLRSPRWSRDWSNWLERLFRDSPWWRGWWGAAIVLGVPLAITAGAFTVLFETSRLLGHAFSLGFLLLMLGPADLNREVERYRRSLGNGEVEGDSLEPVAFVASSRDVPLGATTGDPQFDDTRTELAALAIAADRAWYEPLFWFFVCGPLGALAYRLCANLGAGAADERGIASALAGVREAMEWLPGRITVFALGVAGTLVPVLETARVTGVLRWGATAELIARAALAAIDNGRIHEVITGDPRIYRLNLMHALVRRTLIVWLVFIAAGALALS